MGTVDSNHSSYLHFAHPRYQHAIITSFTWTTLKVLSTKKNFVPEDTARSNHPPIKDQFGIFDISGGCRRSSIVYYVEIVFFRISNLWLHTYLVAEGFLFLLIPLIDSCTKARIIIFKMSLPQWCMFDIGILDWKAYWHSHLPQHSAIPAHKNCAWHLLFS